MDPCAVRLDDSPKLAEYKQRDAFNEVVFVLNGRAWRCILYDQPRRTYFKGGRDSSESNYSPRLMREGCLQSLSVTRRTQNTHWARNHHTGVPQLKSSLSCSMKSSRSRRFGGY